MTIQIINTGTSANAGNGDSLRTAFNKINSNFSSIASLIGTTSTDFNEIAQDAVSNLFIHDNHVGITAEYNDVQDNIILNVTGYYLPDKVEYWNEPAVTTVAAALDELAVKLTAIQNYEIDGGNAYTPAEAEFIIDGNGA
jgi:hypothetical protein